ncbi:Ankyrin repeat-containing protein [Aquimarina amphilecti]|uniref:Ankyrin repeat-containing protein n=1 Tax=Aquimarina amphilecti TaxID=1038014 RepID=A0A1H7LZS0_AQUAM|nr:ankyrin repeat domain-containing protein [Aquimarina amphilecti]SEL04466.1 Ankyrin repeat-containing protein [Aquimarina amphilecti]
MRKTIMTALMILFIIPVGFASEEVKISDSKNYELNINKVDPFFMAVIKGDLDTVAKMIEEGSDVNLRLDGKTPLMYAARYNRADIIRLLIGKGAYLQAKDDKGNTALKFAELANAKEAMDVLKEMS